MSTIRPNRRLAIWLVRFVAITAALLVTTACGSSDAAPTPEPTPTEAVPASQEEDTTVTTDDDATPASPSAAAGVFIDDFETSSPSQFNDLQVFYSSGSVSLFNAATGNEVDFANITAGDTLEFEGWNVDVTRVDDDSMKAVITAPDGTVFG